MVRRRVRGREGEKRKRDKPLGHTGEGHPQLVALVLLLILPPVAEEGR